MVDTMLGWLFVIALPRSSLYLVDPSINKNVDGVRTYFFYIKDVSMLLPRQVSTACRRLRLHRLKLFGVGCNIKQREKASTSTDTLRHEVTGKSQDTD